MYKYSGVTPDKVYDLKVNDDNVKKWASYIHLDCNKAYYVVSFWRSWNASRPKKHIYHIRMTDGLILRYWTTDESLLPQ